MGHIHRSEFRNITASCQTVFSSTSFTSNTTFISTHCVTDQIEIAPPDICSVSACVAMVTNQAQLQRLKMKHEEFQLNSSYQPLTGSFFCPDIVLGQVFFFLFKNKNNNKKKDYPMC